jgi:hypothetical protein
VLRINFILHPFNIITAGPDIAPHRKNDVILFGKDRFVANLTFADTLPVFGSETSVTARKNLTAKDDPGEHDPADVTGFHTFECMVGDVEQFVTHLQSPFFF